MVGFSCIQGSILWSIASVQYYQGKHPCEKPADLLEHIISTSSRENAVVLDAFMGSGSTGQACLKLNRKFIGIEMEEETYVQRLISCRVRSVKVLGI